MDKEGPWRDSLKEHVQRLDKLFQSERGTNLLHYEIAALQARVAYEAGVSQDKIGRRLTLATWALVLATLALVVVAAVLKAA